MSDQNQRDALEERLTSLESQVTSLESQVTSLQSQVDRLRERGSMRGQLRCPACGCQKLLHASEIPDASVGNQTTPKAVQQGVSFWSGKLSARGQFEAFICTGCGQVEWFVRDLGSVDVDGATVRLVDGEAPDPKGPYR